MRRSHIVPIVLGVTLFAQPLTRNLCIGDDCFGEFNGKTPSPAKSQETLSQHADLLETGGSDYLDDPKVANNPWRGEISDRGIKQFGRAVGRVQSSAVLIRWPHVPHHQPGIKRRF
jgi:hypothetical protein